MSFFTRLSERARAIDSLLCVGLDPHPELVGAPSVEAARRWCLGLIEATAPVACAFKPNAAFFEAFGADGWAALAGVIDAARRHAPVILDAKRGDIASTARLYARAAFETLGADAVTLSPYLGRDSIEPFLEDPDRGAFLLCKTSNPGAADLQDLPVGGGEALSTMVARLAVGWNTRRNLGLVVGATFPHTLAEVRAVAPDLWLLAPGVGDQGGDLEQAVRYGLAADRLGMLVAVSRRIARAADPGAEAQAIRAEINHWRSRPPQPPPTVGRHALAEALVTSGCVRFGSFTLKSGIHSPIYFDLRRLASHPPLLRRAAAAYLETLAGLDFDRLAAIPYAALPIGAALALASGVPMIYPRLEVKPHGTRRAVEGEYLPGETVVVIDDLATTGQSKFEAIDRLRSEGLQVADVVVLIDRQSGAAEALADAGLRLHAVFTLTELLELWAGGGHVSPDHLGQVRAFLEGPDPAGGL